MNRPASQPDQPDLPPWPSPSGGFERVMIPDRWERRRLGQLVGLRPPAD